MFFLRFWSVALLISLGCQSATGQPASFRQLEDKVYQYNNEAKYQQAQALLFPLFDNPTHAPDEQFQAAVLLSYTYKRLLDYTTAIKWLAKAHQLARQTTRPDSNQTQIQTQLALAYFDIHQYAKSDRLMRQLERNRFRYVDQENRAKIIHQQGYLLFLAKRYPEAEATYNRAMTDLQVTSPCDMPMILVKKMQLYAATNQLKRAEATLQRACQYADSCGIIKYKIYAYEEMKAIYKARHDLIGVAETGSVLDSLNEAYALAQHIAGLHNQLNQLNQQSYERQLATRQQWLTYALQGGGGMLLLTVWLLGMLRFNRARRLRLENELGRMRAEITAVITYPVIPATLPLFETPTPPRSLRPDVSVLSERQQAVLNGIMAGLSNRAIADKLCISENTVKYHLKNIYVLLDVKDRVDLLVSLGLAKTGH